MEQDEIHELVAALQIKQQSIFDLLTWDFYREEFVFFPQLAAALGETAQVAPNIARRIGMLSELIYLSSKIHFMVANGTEKGIDSQRQIQLSVLIGDLLYGRFIHMLVAMNMDGYLDEYIAYLKLFNSMMANTLRNDEQQVISLEREQLLLLALKTADLFMLASNHIASLNQLQELAEQQVGQQWQHWHEQRITSLAEVEALWMVEKI